MSSLEIDWKILVGQIVNFAILFFALKFFVYGPFTKLVKERRDKIEEGINKSLMADENLKKIDELKEKSIKESEEEKKKAFIKTEEEIKRRKEEAEKKAEEERLLLLAKSKKEAEDIKEKEREKTRKEVIDSAFSLTEKLIKENVDESKNKKIVNDFLNKIET
ncbi:MAG: F0F1 ATP synthase subunit B [Candidatus Pacebacteria bacterium]|nr:F0F1 ATP synthase subunit B [Candidatus Paceibacterota bacterium]